MGLIIWRTLMPEVGNSPNAAVPPTVPANPESSSEADTDLPDAISTPKPLTELLQEAQELQQAQDYNQALALYEEAIAQDELSSQAHSGRCYVLNKLEQYQDKMQ